MLYDLADIRVMRKKADLTQSQLARLAGVSQSLIAKVEAGTLDPAYSNAKKIFEALNELLAGKKPKASEVMKWQVIAAKPEEKINDVVKEMKKHGISQLPVLEGENLVGLISETTILNAVIEGKAKYVKDIMDERPPSVSKDTTVDVISGLLKYFPLVAVFDKHRLVGVITKLDIIERL